MTTLLLHSSKLGTAAVQNEGKLMSEQKMGMSQIRDPKSPQQ